MKDEEISLSGYALVRKDRQSKEKIRGGGVLIYVKNNIEATDVHFETKEDCESIWLNGKV